MIRRKFIGFFLTRGLLVFSLFMVFANTSSAAGATSPWPGMSLQPFVSGIPSPVSIADPGDGSGRLFVVSQTGQIRVVQNGALLGTPFLDISARITSGGERGLLGLAFSPNFASDGFFFVDYTDLSGNTVVSRFHSGASPNTADPASETVVLQVVQPYANHNGGQLAFGPSGYLYIALGDGGSGGDPQNRAQDLTTLLGKILRLDVITPGCVNNPAGSPNYCIPPTNPFAGGGGRGEIWAYGLRNPWRFSFDSQTHDLYIGDVGQNIREEVDFQPAGSAGGINYGWRILEGSLCYDPPTGCTPPQNYAAPVAEYDHGASDAIGCAVVGGYVYRGSLSPAMGGIYFYGDDCSGRIWGLQRINGEWVSDQLYKTPFPISTFGQDASGEVYVADYSGGALYRLAGAALTTAAYLPLVGQ